jgi:hypothetical protein
MDMQYTYTITLNVMLSTSFNNGLPVQQLFCTGIVFAHRLAVCTTSVYPLLRGVCTAHPAASQFVPRQFMFDRRVKHAYLYLHIQGVVLEFSPLRLTWIQFEIR